MFLSEPIKCYESYSFPIKIILIVLGIISQLTIQRRWLMSGGENLPARKAKLAACLSIGLWTAVGIAGKGIPYV